MLEAMDKSFSLRPVEKADVPHFFDQARDQEAVRMAMPAHAAANWSEFSKKWDHSLSGDDFLCRSVICGSDVAGYLAKFTQMEVPSVSYWFGRKFWGQGLARRSLQQFLALIDTRPLYARVASSNAASLSVLTLNGFHQIETASYFSDFCGQYVSEAVLRLDD